MMDQIASMGSSCVRGGIPFTLREAWEVGKALLEKVCVGEALRRVVYPDAVVDVLIKSIVLVSRCYMDVMVEHGLVSVFFVVIAHGDAGAARVGVTHRDGNFF